MRYCMLLVERSRGFWDAANTPCVVAVEANALFSAVKLYGAAGVCVCDTNLHDCSGVWSVTCDC